jgi:DNA-binding CsgD family transcriptional regulator
MAEQTVAISALLEQSREVLSLAERAMGAVAADADGDTGAAQSADAALWAVRRAITDRLNAAQPPSERVSAADLSALLLRAEHVQVALRDSLLAAQRQEIESAQAAINHLRHATSTAALADQIPLEACLMGFTRVLFSYVKQGTWIARSAFAGEDRELAAAMVETGATHPRRLTGALIELDMVRCGQPVLVRNAQNDSRVHPELIAVTKSTDYVAAPVFGWGQPIGLVHADRHGGDNLADFDRQTLGIFAEGLGIAFERNLMIERLQAMRRAADDHLRMATALADDFTLEVMDLAGPAPNSVSRRGDEYPVHPRGPIGHDASLLYELTARELEVLRAIAAGKTNAQIATGLFVTEGTVKSHVKHILRKLGAGNRTEAVAKYHRAQNGSGSYPNLG